MPIKEKCFQGEQYLEACRRESHQVLQALKMGFATSKRFPRWAALLEVIPARADPDGTFVTIPCVIINVDQESPDRCPPKIFHPSVLPEEPTSLAIPAGNINSSLVKLTTREAELLTQFCFLHRQPIVGQPMDTDSLKTTAIARHLLTLGVPIVTESTTDKKPITCIVPLILSSESQDVTGDQDFIDKVRELAYAGVTQGLAHKTEI